MEQSISAPFLSETQTPVSGVGFGIRFAARVIDMIVHYIIWYVAAYIIGIAINIYAMISGIPVSEILANSGSSSVYGFFLALFGSFFYQTFSEYICGASLGKIIFKIHVLSDDGQPISFKAAVIRSAAYFVDGMVFGLVAYENMKKTPLRQRYGDKWANTIVVKRSSLAKIHLPTGWKFMLAFIVGVIADGLCAIVSTLINYL